jgi:hypothetical protein
MFVKHRLRIRRAHFALATWLLPFCGACGDMDWNWDLDWWQKPKRVVRPIRPQQSQDRQRSPQPATNPAVDQAPAPPPGEQTRSARSASDRSDLSALPAPNPRPSTPDRAGLPFYQLYLTNGGHSREEQPGERRLSLSSANARACASLIEMLYVPMGRSGSDDECYLIYENPSEYEAATALVTTLDVPASDKPISSVGAAEAYKAGISQTLWILAQGATVDGKLVDDCERHLVEALQSTQLPAPNRWSAGIMAGRLASEFKYDYASAKSYYRQAEQVAGDGSIERMTALWWLADALVQEGQAAEARTTYQAIVNEYGDWRNSQIVRRSLARLEERRNR